MRKRHTLWTAGTLAIIRGFHMVAALCGDMKTTPASEHKDLGEMKVKELAAAELDARDAPRLWSQRAPPGAPAATALRALIIAHSAADREKEGARARCQTSALLSFYEICS